MNKRDVDPIITTIIPTYRRPWLLSRAISSVLAQTYPHFKLCVYDNASGDETADVVRDFALKDSRVEYYCHEKNIGAAANFQYGIKQVETCFFNMLSDDDYILPSFFKQGIVSLQENPEALFFAGETIRIDPFGNIWDIPLEKWRDEVYCPPAGFVEMLQKGHPEWTGIIFRKKVISSIGNLDLETGGAVDLDYELRIAAKHQIVVSRNPCALFISYADSGTVQFRLAHTWPGWLKMIDNIKKNEYLSAEVKNMAILNLTKKLKKRIYVSGVKGVVYGFEEDARKASDVLEEVYGIKLKPNLLRILGKDSNISYFFRQSIKMLNKMRQLCFKMIICRKWEKKVGNIKRYISDDQGTL